MFILRNTPGRSRPAEATEARNLGIERDVPLNRFGSFSSMGQATAVAPAPVRLPAGRAPQLNIAWGSFHQGIGSSLGVLLRKSTVPRNFSIEGFFKYCWIESKVPRRAVIAAALWHIVFFVLPYPRLPSRAHHNPSFDNVELSWSGPINDLPLLEMKAPKPEPSPRAEPEKPPVPEGADAFHPRQYISTDPVPRNGSAPAADDRDAPGRPRCTAAGGRHPNHPRQTLINSAA